MRVLAVLLSATLFASASAYAEGPAQPPRWPPIRLEMRVPFAPAAFPSEKRVHLLYELHLTNFDKDPLHISRIEVLDLKAPAAPPIVTFAAQQLLSMLRPSGAALDSQGNYQLAGNGSAIVFVSIDFDQDSQVPERLMHRVVTTEGVMEGAAITTHSTTLHVLGPPLQGAGWLAHEGPSNDNHHRRGMLVVNGKAVFSGRYAIDWNKIESDKASSGDKRDLRSYYGYGQPVLAVADARVVTARDGFPDNAPGQGDAFQPAVPTTLDNQSGNMIVLDLGGGQFARYMHLRPGSVRVKSGDRVRVGQVLAQLGSSGDSRGPHLHFEVTNSSGPDGEGVPYVFDSYAVTSEDGRPMGVRKHELPLKDTFVVFPEHQGR